MFVQFEGTDEAAIVSIVGSHSMKQRQQIRKKYFQVYKKDLLKELNGELSFDFAKLVAALMTDPEDYILDCIHRALVPQSIGGKFVKRLSGLFKDGLGKTEYTLMSMIFPRSNKQLEQIKEAFLKKYEVDMDERIASGGNDLPQDFCALLLEIVSGDRVEEEEGEVDLEEVEEDVDVLVDGEAWEEPFQVIMQERSFHHLRKVLEMYKKETGRVLDELVDESEELSLELKETYKALLLLIKSEPEFYADRLKKAIQGAGTDDETLIRVVVMRSEVDLLDIMDVYKKKYKVSLAEDVAGDCSGDYNDLLMMLLTVPSPEELKKKGEKKVKKIPRVKKEKKKKDHEEEQGEAGVEGEEDLSVSDVEVEKKKTVRRKPKVKGKREEEEEVEAPVEEEVESVCEAEKKNPVRRKPKVKGKREEDEDVEAPVEEEVETVCEAEKKKPVRRKPKAKAKKEEEEEEVEDVQEEEEEVKKKSVRRPPKVATKVKAKKEEEEEEDEVEDEEEEVEEKKPIRRKPKVVPKVIAKKDMEDEEEEEAEQDEVVTVSKAVEGNESGVATKKQVKPEEEVEVEEALEEEEIENEEKQVEHSGEEDEVDEEAPVEAAQAEEAKEEMEEEPETKVEEDSEEDEEEKTEKKVKSSKDVGNELTTTTAASSDEGGDSVLVKSREL